jgi:hypothetical protein
MFLYHAYDLMVVGLGQSLEGRLANDVAEIHMVFAVLWIAELVDKKLNGIL